MFATAFRARLGGVFPAAARSLSSGRVWNVYLAGEIHTDWRERIISGSVAKGLLIEFSSPNTVHEDSDDCAANILEHLDAPDLDRYFYDDAGARLNSLRNKTLMEEADVVVARWDDCT